jgi:transcription-repair coupling factor (superfamily II helicase)
MTTYSPLYPILPHKPGQRQLWGQLHSIARSLAIYSAALSHDAPLVIIAEDMQMASRLYNELQFFAHENQQLDILSFPDWEILPYDSFSPHTDIISQRLATLNQLLQFKKGIVIVPINTLMHRIAPRDYIEKFAFVLKKNQILDLDQFRQRLVNNGYQCVSQVMEHGEFAIRGSIIDLYPMGNNFPFRIDLFDNEIDSIRIFNPENQRSQGTIDEISLLPAREFPLNEEGISHFRQSWRNKFTGNPTLCPIYENMSKGLCSAGIEYYIPLFFPKTNTLFDYLSPDSVLVRCGDIDNKANHFWDEVCERYEQLSHNITHPILAPVDILLLVPQVFAAMKAFPQVYIYEEALTVKAGTTNYSCQKSPELPIQSKSERPLDAVKQYIASTETRILFCAETLGRREFILELLNNIDIYPVPCSSWKKFLNADTKIGITVAALDHGFTLLDPPIVVITESQLFGQQIMQRRLRKRTGYSTEPEAIIKDLTELKIGAPVVHVNHGIGRYVGLQSIKTDDYEAEYLTLEYAGNDKLYVPVSSLHLISRYTGRDDEYAPLYQLGAKKWEKIKQKTAQRIRDIAVELFDIYTRRQAKTGFAFSKPDNHYLTFAAEFPFEETPDQQKAIEAVITDMTSQRSMDRLICGDVGFGKTEVAMRSAFLATQDNKQVAVLVPTTLLAEQHLQNFKDRFANWPIKIEGISRFRSKKEQEKIIEEITQGKADIIIGTHKLLQSNIKFKSLGLLVIDEEHRFGVQQKEKIKSLKAEVDILTLTATPIPRTLNFSLIGVRDFSIIATPPAKRLSIKTFVREYNAVLIREAILREILRGGQVYFLHNDVRSIEKMADTIGHLVPEAKVNIVHGQMTERILEKVMSDFYHSRFNVLVTTTIIESGIDIPTANTMIINNANRFGLAQLHQLRGRVGRSHHQAYTYLLTPPEPTLTKDAKQRLEAIQSLEDLGAGFTLATYDLEIRGSGEILGEEQSGFIEEVGFSLYMELLENAVQALKEGKEPHLDQPLHYGTEIDLHISALIPDSYVPDVSLRLTLYKRIANAKNEAILKDIQIEMVDRFGLLPPQTKNLFRITEIKLKAAELGIRKMEIRAENGRIEFETNPRIDIEALLELIQKQPQKFQLQGSKILKFTISENTLEEKFEIIDWLIDKLMVKKT